MALLNDRVDPEAAVESGLATEAVPASEFDDRLDELAGRIADGPTVALGRSMKLMTESTSARLEEQLAAETDSIARTARTEDFAEGVSAFGAKRDPEFEGK